MVGVDAPPIADAVRGAIETVLERLAPWAGGGALANFAGGVDAVAVDRVRRGYGRAVCDRLDALRAELDPDGILVPARWVAQDGGGPR